MKSIIFYLIILLIGTAHSHEIHYVDDDFNELPNANYSSIQDAVNIAQSGDTIKVAPGFYQENIWGLSGITLESIEGPERTIIDGSNLQWSLIVIYGAPSTIDGFTLQNGSGSDIYGLVRGGAIYVEFTTCEIKNCIFSNNRCEKVKYDNGSIGGAIGTYSGAITVDNCLFENNYCSHDGGAISINGGTGVITNSKFINNISEDYGGAIAARESNLELSECILKSNFSLYGGAIACLTRDDYQILNTATIQNCLFRRNMASEYGYGPGGAIFSNNYSIFITKSAFEDTYGYTSAIPSQSASPANIQIENNSFCGNLFNDWTLNVEDLGNNNSLISCECSGDINSDGIINVLDLIKIISEFGSYYTPKNDVNRDFEINIIDILEIISNFNKDCS